MSAGIFIFTIWFVAVAAYLVWQFAHNTLAAYEVYEPEPVFASNGVVSHDVVVPAPVVARPRFDRLPAAS